MNKYLRFRVLALLLAVLLFGSLSGCTAENQLRQDEFFALNTYIVCQTDANVSAEEAGGAMTYTATLEKILSRTLEGGELYHLNRAPAGESTPLSSTLVAVLQRAQAYAEKTAGAFDYTAGALTELWRITDESAPLPTAAQIEEAQKSVGYDKVLLQDNALRKEQAGTVIDLGGIAKGYVAEKLVEYYRGKGAAYGILSLGGNIAVFGEKPQGGDFRIGIADPTAPTSTVGYVRIRGGADSVAFVSVSGGYERYKEVDGVRYSHIFDTATGYPADTDLASVAVIAADGMLADALSTALYVMGYERALAFIEQTDEDFAAVLIKEDGEIFATENAAFTRR